MEGNCYPLAVRSALAAEVKFREVWAWSMYDFANSAYTTVVITAVFGAYFVAGVAGNATWATFAWTAALSISYAAILFTGPLVGAWADAHAAKKRLLLISTVNGFTVDETGVEDSGAPDRDPAHLQEAADMARDYIASLPVNMFPNMTELAGEFALSDPDERFELLIEIFVDGLGRRAAAA